MRINPRTEPALFSKAGAGPSADPVTRSLKGRSVVLCLGNRYLRDDGIGIRVAEALKGILGSNVLVDVSQTMDLPLLTQYEGASRVVVVDALKSGARPGEVSRYTLVPNGRPLQALNGPHSLGLHDFFDIAWQTGLLKGPVTIVGIEPKDCGLGEGLTEELEGAIPRVVAEVEAALAC
jgi:hydrogenase maturation protease